MWLFIFILAVLIGIIWGYYFLIRTTEIALNALFQRVASATIDLTNAVQTAIHSLTQRAFRLLAVIGLPLSEAAELGGVTLNQLHQILVEVLNSLHKTVRNLAIAFSAWLGLLIIATLVGNWTTDLMFAGIVVFSMIVLSFVTISYDPLIEGIASKYKIRRSIRPISLVYGLSSVMFMWWLAFHGATFYSKWLYILAVYILILIAFGFPSYYFMKTTNRAGIAINITLILLLIISVVRISNERIYTNANLYLQNNAEKMADGIASANAEKTLNVFLVTESTPVISKIEKNKIIFRSMILDSSEIILKFRSGEKVSVISEDIVYIGNEGFVKIMMQDKYGHFVKGPFYAPKRLLKKNNLTPVTEQKISQTNEIKKDDNVQYINHQFPVGTRYKLYSKSGKEFYYKTSSNKWILIESGQLIEVDNEPPSICQVRPKYNNDYIRLERQ
jgi:hypothetical protein